MQDYQQAAAYVSALAPGESLDWRCIHDTDRAVPAIIRRGTLEQHWQELCNWNAHGYGVFVTVSALDGTGRTLSNVTHARAHYVDLDSVMALQSLQQAAGWSPAPGWYVQSSAGKAHVYWPVQPYLDLERFKAVQRRLAVLFNGDHRVIDATRVLRVPGFANWKYGQPQPVTCAALGGYGQRVTIDQLEAALAHVQVIDTNEGQRHELGDPALAAPSLGWIKRALTLADPNDMDRLEWISFTAAIKQAAWTHASPDAIFAMWSNWCARYARNDIGENAKQWASLTDTQVGWPYIVRRYPTIVLDGTVKSAPVQPAATPSAPASAAEAIQPPPLDCSSDILTHFEQQIWFKGCTAITRSGEILTPEGRFMKPAQFNMRFGGKQFIISASGKLTDEPWKAATRSTMWTVPQADHTRFLPSLPFGEIIVDQLGRRGVNTYIPVQIKRSVGDVSPFLRHMQMMLPVESDRKLVLDFLAHNIKYPGHKIPWAPMIQSTEGTGKGFIQKAMERILGEMYCYSPKAQELVKSGSTFNAWMRAKLLIIVNEIKVDERRELVEILKPMITDERVEIQAKGIDQEMEDNCANWIFFSNFKDAIPVSQNGRRYAIFYSALQTKADLMRLGMDDAYFNALFNWLYNGGSEIIAQYLTDYPIERGALPGKAPNTSSTEEAVNLSRSPVERLILDCIADGVAGFRGGWVSVQAVHRSMSEKGMKAINDSLVEQIIAKMGFLLIGRLPRPYMQESRLVRSVVFNTDPQADMAQFGRLQGYE
jgi:hypothetical protein